MPVDVEAKVKAIIAEQLQVDEGQVTPEANLVDDLGADLLQIVKKVDHDLAVLILDPDPVSLALQDLGLDRLPAPEPDHLRTDRGNFSQFHSHLWSD